VIGGLRGSYNKAAQVDLPVDAYTLRVPGTFARATKQQTPCKLARRQLNTGNTEPAIHGRQSWNDGLLHIPRLAMRIA
jgi:hypothetical protein